MALATGFDFAKCCLMAPKTTAQDKRLSESAERLGHVGQPLRRLTKPEPMALATGFDFAKCCLMAPKTTAQDKRLSESAERLGHVLQKIYRVSKSPGRCPIELQKSSRQSSPVQVSCVTDVFGTSLKCSNDLSPKWDLSFSSVRRSSALKSA